MYLQTSVYKKYKKCIIITVVNHNLQFLKLFFTQQVKVEKPLNLVSWSIYITMCCEQWCKGWILYVLLLYITRIGMFF